MADLKEFVWCTAKVFAALISGIFLMCYIPSIFALPWLSPIKYSGPLPSEDHSFDPLIMCYFIFVILVTAVSTWPNARNIKSYLAHSVLILLLCVLNGSIYLDISSGRTAFTALIYAGTVRYANGTERLDK